jgi:hypothetical protein
MIKQQKTNAKKTFNALINLFYSKNKSLAGENQ